MNWRIHQLIFFILISIKSVHNLPNGAPASACATMTPGHGVASQQCSSKYIIQSDKSQYYTNDIVHITVNGSTSSDLFEGILLIAKTETSGQIIGTWSVVSPTTQTLACGGISDTGITHNSPSDKSLVEAIWYPPSNIYGENTIIKATIVQVFSLIYVNCFSVTLTNGELTTPNTTATNISTTSSNTTMVSTTTIPQTTVGVNISWTYTNGVTTVKMQITNLKTSQWLALGLSLDQFMGDDHVFVCQRLANDTVLIQRFINPGGHTPPVLASTITNPGGTFTSTLQKLENGTVYCEFTLSNFAGSKRRRRDISSLSPSISYYPLIATGNLDSSNAMIYHTSRTALSQMVQLNQQEMIIYNIDSTNSNRTGLIKAHGIIMIFTWILFVSTGILLARHFKPSWPDKKICGKPIWFAVHRVLMTSVAVLILIAFTLILVYNNGQWVSRNYPREFAHSIVGIITISFAVIQPIMALFRCKPDAKYRFIFNYAHRTVGLTAFILSIVAIFLAMFFTEFHFQMNNEWGILVAWTCWLPIIFFIFWFIDFYFRRYSSNKENPDSYGLNNLHENVAQKNEPTQVINNVKQDRIKGIFLLIHIMIAFGLALALAILIGQA